MLDHFMGRLSKDNFFDLKAYKNLLRRLPKSEKKKDVYLLQKILRNIFILFFANKKGIGAYHRRSEILFSIDQHLGIIIQQRELLFC